jgi:hypothetical protein
VRYRKTIGRHQHWEKWCEVIPAAKRRTPELADLLAAVDELAEELDEVFM